MSDHRNGAPPQPADRMGAKAQETPAVGRRHSFHQMRPGHHEEPDGSATGRRPQKRAVPKS